jgi:glucokinase
MARSLLDRNVGAIGVGVAGLVTDSGVLEWGPNVAGEHVDFLSRLQRAFELPTLVDNDANLAGFAEARLGAGRGHRVVLMVTLGTGIGGGLTIDGEIYRGRGYAGEIGHMVVDVGGPRCSCGQRGCWETFASGRRLDQMARDAAAQRPTGRIAELAHGVTPTGRHLTSAAIDGDEQARMLLAEVGSWLGIGLSTLIAILDPDVIVIGGGVSQAGDALLDPTRSAIAESLEGYDVRTPTPVVAAAFGEDAALVGAGLAALRNAHV